MALSADANLILQNRIQPATASINKNGVYV